MYNGESNAQKLDNWIRQMEVYFHFQQIDEDEVKIQLASTHIEGTTLIWWEGKLQEGIQKSSNILFSWSKFIDSLSKQFYPLAYRQKEIMEWKYLRQGKGQSVQGFTEEFRKKAWA
jgi:hypothetical protein